jgi:hypothetical protein
MLENILISPSVMSLVTTGLLLLVIIILIITNFRQILKLELYKLLTLIAIITVAFGIHGLLHSSAEINYNFNPYKWF